MFDFKMSKKLKASWIENVSELTFSGDEVFCRACSKIIVCGKKFQVYQHLKTSKHKNKLHKMNSKPSTYFRKFLQKYYSQNIDDDSTVSHQAKFHG